MRIFSEDSNELQLLGRPHLVPTDSEVEMWFLTPPVDGDGIVAVTPYAHVLGWETLWVHDEWFASGQGHVILNIRTSLSVSGGEISSVTTLIDDRGPDKNIYRLVNDEFVLRSVAIPVQMGDKVLIHLTAGVSTECTNGIAQLDLCQGWELTGIQVHHVLATWQSGFVII